MTSIRRTAACRTDLANLVNTFRKMRGQPVLDIGHILRVCRLVFGPEGDIHELFNGLPPGVEPVPKQRVCKGHDTPAGHVKCAYDLSGSPGHRARCNDCGIGQDRYRRWRRRHYDKARRPKGAPSYCKGYDTKQGHVDCGKLLEDNHRLRCEPCSKFNRRWLGHKYDGVRRIPRGELFHEHKPITGGVAHRPVKHCDECADLSERRPLQGLCKCGRPWMPERIERGEVLRSSMGGEMQRNRSR